MTRILSFFFGFNLFGHKTENGRLITNVNVCLINRVERCHRAARRQDIFEGGSYQVVDRFYSRVDHTR